ncbi:MAG: class II glutamine amidotransferase [Eubacterium sp.]|nr:class II glutamine amidotransferase [Eubacterium sp.]
MCEIFGITADRKVHANELLREFFSHSSEHRDGWGLVGFDDGYPSVEKEPVTAKDSAYLKARLAGEISAAHMAAHIRRATCGTQEYENTHPFVRRDAYGRAWTLVHNGHIFEAPVLRQYLDVQKGATDSERILCYIADEAGRINGQSGTDGHTGNSGSADGGTGTAALTDQAFSRILLVEKISRELSPENKLNFILFDGELMYVHTNEPGGLYVKNNAHSRIFSTKPLDAGGVAGWEEVAQNQLHVYKDAAEIYTGRPHGFTYVSDTAKEDELYINYSFL